MTEPENANGWQDLVRDVLDKVDSLPEFMQGGLMVGAIMGWMMERYDQRQPSREDFIEMMREVVQDDIAENFELYLGYKDEEKEEGES
jgi:F0F1-type ATP synthase assembly protein I